MLRVGNVIPKQKMMGMKLPYEKEAAYKEMLANSQTEVTLTAEERIAQAEAKIQEALAEIEAIKAEIV
jgi:hypothetical protein